MGSVGNQNPWAPYNNYRDCSQGICSLYCPQFCYFFFPPPPPSTAADSTPLSPLIIAVIGVLASAFLLVSYYTVVTRYCYRRSPGGAETINHEADQLQWRAGPSGLDESLIRAIAVREYRKGDGMIEGTECAVCLSEFRENEPLRLLPKCKHAFHLPCIDTWLRSQSSCPLCRAGVVVLAQELGSQRVDVVLEVDDGERENGDDVEIKNDDDDDDDDDDGDDGGGGVKRFGRSVSLGAFSFRRLKLIDETDEDVLRVENGQRSRDIGSSKGCVRSDVAMRRSVSTGELICMVHGKGKDYLLPD